MTEDKSIIYAGIVTYNPDIKRLQENIISIHSQVPQVVIFDNGSSNILKVVNIIERFDNVSLIKSEKNMGIAVALNRLMQWGEDNRYEWMLSLDQDSVCGDTYVSSMLPYLSVQPNLGIVAPVIVDRNIGIIGHNPKSDYEYVNTCITSGAFSRITAWRNIGGYDESMFIDSVDFEYCYRMRKNGYGIIQVKDIKLLHAIGNSQKRRFLFWKIDVTGHSAFRKYYIARNNIYYPLKHHLLLYFIRGTFRNFFLLIIVTIYEDDKIDKIKSIIKGWKNGIKGVKTLR